MATRRILTALAALAGLIPASVAAHVLPLTARQQVEASDHVVVAVVESASARWSGRLIVTDYGLRIEEQLRGETQEGIAITLPGGTIGNETHETCLALPLAVGERYLLFLGDLGRGDRPGLSPLVGGPLGAVRDGAGFAAAVRSVRGFLEGDGSGDLEALVAAEQEGIRQTQDEFTLGTLAVPPVVMSPLPGSSEFSPYDQEQMDYWNVYQPDLFRVGSPANDWHFGNGVSEVAGFPSDAKMQAEAGQPWMGTTVSFTLSRIVDGRLVETDIALNPAVRWTLDEAAATRPDGPLSFRKALLGNLGIAWGLRRSFSLSDRESAVTASANRDHAATLFSDDAAALRAAFGGTQIRDGLISGYSILPAPLRPRHVAIRLTPGSVKAGARFKVVNPIKIENVGTETIANPKIDIYLVPERFSLDGAVLLKSLKVGGSLASRGVRNVTVGSLTAPKTLPPGVYFLAFRLRAAGDEYPGNDTAWSPYNVFLDVKAP